MRPCLWNLSTFSSGYAELQPICLSTRCGFLFVYLFVLFLFFKTGFLCVLLLLFSFFKKILQVSLCSFLEPVLELAL